jgi:3-oxoacyl-[acyl-carrier-protein] synthase-3
LIAAGQYRRILIVGAEVHSTGLDISTRGRDIAVLFGDGAGSCIAESAATWAQADRRGLEILSTELHGDGAHVEELWCEHIGSAHFPTRVTQDLIDEAKIFPKMNGKKVFEHAVKRMTEVSHSVLARAGQSAAQVNWFVPHQANLRINSMVASQLGLREAAAINTITHYGNTTAATIPIGMSHLFEEHELKVDELVLSAAFGAGFTWGAALLRVV